MTITVTQLTLAVILGALGTILFSLRILIILERRVASMEANIQALVKRVLREEQLIERRMGVKKKTKATKTKR